MALPVVYIEIRGTNTQTEVFLNDIPVERFGHDGQPVHTSRVSEYLVAGRNVIEVVVGPGPTPSRVHQPGTAMPSPDAKGALRFAAYYSPKALVGTGGQELLRAEWASGSGSLTRAVNLDLPHGGWAWETADILQLDGPTLREVQALVEGTHRAFVERDAEFLLEHSRVRLTELSRCYDPPDPAYWLSTFRRGVFNGSDSADWKVVPLEDQEPDYRLCAGGRLVDCVNTKWQSLVRTELRGTTLSDYRMFVGRIGGVWHVLR